MLSHAPEVKRPSSQYPAQLGQHLAGVGDGAQGEGGQRRVATGVGQLEGMAVKADVAYRDGPGAGPLGRQRPATLAGSTASTISTSGG